MISIRYAGPVALLLALASIPTVIHNYLGLTRDDGVSIKTINPVLENFTSSPSKRNPNYGEETFGSEDWVERVYTNDEGKSIRLFVAKGYDHKRLYHHPELALSYAKDLRNFGKTALEFNTAIEVSLLKNDSRTISAAFILLYNGNPISNPIKHQILDSINLLISPKRPMALFYVSDDNTPENKDFNQTAAALLMTKAIKDYQSKLTSAFK